MDKLSLSKRPKYYRALVFQYQTGCGKIFITVSVDDSGYPAETFISVGKSGGCTQAFAETVGKMTSIALRCGIDAQIIIAQYSDVKCDNGAWDDGERVTSCAGAVAMALKAVTGGLGLMLIGTGPGVAVTVKHPDLSDEEVREQVALLKAERDKLEDEVDG